MIRRTLFIRAMAVAGILTASLALTFCDRVVDPPLPSDAEQFSPPGVYSTWWNMTQTCSGLTGSLGAVTWYKTDEVLHDTRTGEAIVGYWTAGSNRIIINNSVMLDGAAVRHEMLHALLQKGGHPRNQFLGKCSGTVSCQHACILDAGPYPPPPETPIHVTGESLEFTVDVEPGNPIPAFDGGFFTITVLVRNRSAHWATVTPLSSSTDTTSSFTFAVINTSTGGGMTGGEIALDPSERIFAPGETKKHVFDFRIGDDAFSRQLQAGSCLVRGGYSDYVSADSPFVIGP
jgi:hypothetical protein